MHLRRHASLKSLSKQSLPFSVALLEAIDSSGLLLEVHIAGIKGMVFRVNLAAVYPFFGIHRTPRCKFCTVAHYNRYFVVFWVNSFFHNSIEFLYCLFKEPNIRGYQAICNAFYSLKLSKSSRSSIDPSILPSISE